MSPFLPFFQGKTFQICHHLSWFMLHCNPDHSQQFLSFTCSDMQVEAYISDVYTCTYPPLSLVNLAVGPFTAHTSFAKTSLLSNPSSPSLTAKTYNTTSDSQLPYKTNITAKVPSVNLLCTTSIDPFLTKAQFLVQALAISLLDRYSSSLAELPACSLLSTLQITQNVL